MAEQTKVELKVTPRDVVGKKVSRLRREGVIPANVYGHGADSVAIHVPEDARVELRGHGAGRGPERPAAGGEGRRGRGGGRRRGRGARGGGGSRGERRGGGELAHSRTELNGESIRSPRFRYVPSLRPMKSRIPRRNSPAGRARPPSRCATSTARMPSPVVTPNASGSAPSGSRFRCSGVSFTTVPGAAPPPSASGQASQTCSSAPSIVLYAPGHGV